MALIRTALSVLAVLTVLALGLAGCADTPGRNTAYYNVK